MYGFVFNVNINFSYFEYIIFCGIVDDDKVVIFMEVELGYMVDIEEVKIKLRIIFVQFFEYEYVDVRVMKQFIMKIY